MILEVASYLIWVSILLFLLGMVFEEHARRLSAVGWVTFGAYWFSRFPRYYGETHSFIKTFLVIAALPVSVYFAYHVLRGKDVLVRLSQTVAAMGLIYLPSPPGSL
ncbi:MAG: archaeosortase A [Halobacteria archaeon]|nr:archaeosortase A [Halobacteria archaeon]